ncbi:DPP IV N-terminal domain-containing protein [Aggregatilineales bacterium SYSU G02658]
MLLRAYRISDRLGLVLIKLIVELVALLWWVVRGVAGLFWAIILGLLAVLSGSVRALVRLMSVLIRAVVGLSGRVARPVARGMKSGVRAAVRSTSSAGGSMARRAAARESASIKVVEDPLRAQNRRLSAAVVVLGFAMVGVLLWATDPARSSPAPVVASGGLAADPLANAPAPITPESPASVLGLPTPIPVATQVPVALRGGGTIAYTVRENGQTDIWLVAVANRQAIRITNDLTDERDPAWSPDGTRLAYASRRDGNWEIYVFDMLTQETTRITFDLSYQGKPKWSPDGLFLVYESYQGNNLDIYAVPVDGSAPATRITDHPAPDFSPAWSNDGRRIAFVSLRDGNRDIYVFNLDTLEVTNLTNTPLRDEDNPVWSRDDRQIAFSAWDNGVEKVFVMPSTGGEASAVAFGRTPAWSPDGLSLTFAADSVDGQQSFLYALPLGAGGGIPADILNVPRGASSPTWSERPIPPALLNSGLPPGNPEPLFVERSERSSVGAPFRLSPLLDVQAPSAVLSDEVNESFNALRQRVFELSGRDFLSVLDDAFWDLQRLPNPGEPRRSWHMTGRAFALRRTAILGFPPDVEILREQRGVDTVWRIMLRVADNAQSGQLGEPLRAIPWDFLSASGTDVEAYNQGGRFRAEVPTGYYIDLTQLAEDYGWLPMPAGSDWRANVAQRNFWMFYKPEGLDWCAAMLRIYTRGEMVNFCGQGT